MARSEGECETRSRSRPTRSARPASWWASVPRPFANTAADERAATASSWAWTRTNVDVERPRAASEARSEPSAAVDCSVVASCCSAFMPGAPCPPQPASRSTPASTAQRRADDDVRRSRRRPRGSRGWARSTRRTTSRASQRRKHRLERSRHLPPVISPNLTSVGCRDGFGSWILGDVLGPSLLLTSAGSVDEVECSAAQSAVSFGFDRSR